MSDKLDEDKIKNALASLGWKNTPANRRNVAKGLREWGIDPTKKSKKK